MPDVKPVLIGSDHGGYDLKEQLKKHLAERKIPFTDAGADHLDPQDDYPIFAARVASQVSAGTFERGIVICGTGIGASMAANRWKRVRAALCSTPENARLSREHNDANVLALGGRTTPPDQAIKILDAWLDAKFEGGRHERRVRQLDE